MGVSAAPFTRAAPSRVPTLVTLTTIGPCVGPHPVTTAVTAVLRVPPASGWSATQRTSAFRPPLARTATSSSRSAPSNRGPRQGKQGDAQSSQVGVLKIYAGDVNEFAADSRAMEDLDGLITGGHSSGPLTAKQPRVE